MRLTVNLRHLDAHIVHLEGELPVEDLDIDTRDEMIQVLHPLAYDLEVQKLEGGLLVQGRLHLTLDCKCVRCLKPFQFQLEHNWTRHLSLEGEEAPPVVNDCVDLTPLAREDILLELPQHPLCAPECRGLPKTHIGKETGTSGGDAPAAGSSAWAELNKLKL